MINPVLTPQPIQGASGQFVEVVAQFQSDLSLAGKLLYFNPGLFTGAAGPPPNASAWSLIYPGAAGTYNMNFNAPDIWRNYIARLTVINSKNFQISLKFFFATDIEYIGGNFSPNNANPFNGGSAYTAISGGTIALYVRVEGESAVSYIPVQASPFCNPNLEITVLPIVAGENLEVIFSGAANPSSEFYVGFYRTDNVSNVENLVDDLNLSYAKISGSSVTAVPDLPNTAIVGGQGFQNPGGITFAKAIINNNTLEQGGEYRIYAVYQDSGSWRSCLSGIIEYTEPPVPIFGDVVYEITDEDGNVYNEGCLNNVPTCKTLQICVKQDQTSYDASAAAAGVPAPSFASALVSKQNTFAGTQVGALTVAQLFFDVDGIRACFPYEVEAGLKYIVFQFIYLYPDGRKDRIFMPVQVSGTPTTVLGAPPELCAEKVDPINVELPVAPGPTATCQASMYDTPGVDVPAEGLTIAGGVLSIDPTTIPIGQARCFEICCEDASGDASDCTCEGCECLSITISQSTCGNAGGGGTTNIDYYLGVLGVQNDQITELRLFSAQGHTNSSTQNSLSGSIIFPTEPNTLTNYYRVELQLENGCLYKFPIQSIETNVGDVGGCSKAIRSFEWCTAECNCEDEPGVEDACDNVVGIDYSCDENEVTVSPSGTITSPVASDRLDCSTDGGETFSPCAGTYTGEVYVRREVVFSDDCKPITTTQVARCTKAALCVNSAELSIDITEDVLTLTLTGTYQSPVVAENIYYSVDGGDTFEVYSGPVTLPNQANVRAYSVTSFSDGCPDVVTPTQTGQGPTDPNELPLIEYCDAAGNITGYAGVIVNGDGTTSTYYFDADLQPQQAPPAGAPCENYVPCETC